MLGVIQPQPRRPIHIHRRGEPSRPIYMKNMFLYFRGCGLTQHVHMSTAFVCIRFSGPVNRRRSADLRFIRFRKWVRFGRAYRSAPDYAECCVGVTADLALHSRPNSGMCVRWELGCVRTVTDAVVVPTIAESSRTQKTERYSHCVWWDLCSWELWYMEVVRWESCHVGTVPVVFPMIAEGANLIEHRSQYQPKNGDWAI